MRELQFAERVARTVRAKQSRLMVGLDPVIERFPESLRSLDREDALVAFARGVIEAVRDYAVAIKTQIAFFEQYGWRGWRAFGKVLELAAASRVLVVVDAKRGDVGSTARAYANAFLGEDPETFGPWVDALTINPYLGRDAIDPFVARAREGRRGLFLLARTSNLGASDFQDRISEGEPLYRFVARFANSWNEELEPDSEDYGVIGLVAGATFPEQLAEIRSAAPRSILLVPGLGAQGGTAGDLACAFDSEGLGALASSSRDIIYAYERAESAGSWQQTIGDAADRQRRALEDAIESRGR